MENRKILVVLIILVIILGWALTAVIAYFMGFQKGQISNSIEAQKTQPNSSFDIKNEPTENQKDKTDYVTIKDNQPENILGEIEFVNNKKITIKSSDSDNAIYEIPKSDVGVIILMAKNPLFDEAKLIKIQEELNSLLPPAPQSSEQIADKNTQEPEVPEEARIKMEELQKDPTLKMFDEKEVSWDELKSGMQINLTTQDDKRKITIYPVES